MVSDSFQQGAVSAAWVHPKESRQWWTRRAPGQLLLIEGAPDRLPSETETLLEWLSGRWGSFRGFEISFGAPDQPPQISAFVDPVCTRPIFYHLSSNTLLLADKLATLALNNPGPSQLNWDAVLEAMLLGSLYRYNLTTLKGAEELAPGETIAFRDNQIVARYSNQMPEDSETSASAVRANPEASLAAALQRSVRECWTDPQAALLLSGGLDSRAILALAGESRKAVTLEMSARETEIAKQIAEVCGAKFIALPFPSDEWLRRAQEGLLDRQRHARYRIRQRHWIGRSAGAVRHPRHRPWLSFRHHPERLAHPAAAPACRLSPTVLGRMGPAGVHFRDTTSRASFHADKDVLGLFSKDGAQQAITQLRGTAESLNPVKDGRFDITFERHILGWVSKQVHYGCYLSWMEAFDLSSPVFHPALWSWYRHTNAEDRYLGRAYRRALVGMQHPVFAIPDANTGTPISLPKERWTDTAQDRLWYRAARRIWRIVRRDRQPPYSDKRSARFRSPEGRAAHGVRHRDPASKPAVQCDCVGTGVRRNSPEAAIALSSRC